MAIVNLTLDQVCDLCGQCSAELKISIRENDLKAWIYEKTGLCFEWDRAQGYYAISGSDDDIIFLKLAYL